MTPRQVKDLWRAEGIQLRQAIIGKGMTQSEFARRMGWGKDKTSRVIAGKDGALDMYHTRKMVAELLGVAMDYFDIHDGHHHRQTQDESREDL